jgi:hypothetical protein
MWRGREVRERSGVRQKRSCVPLKGATRTHRLERMTDELIARSSPLTVSELLKWIHLFTAEKQTS